MRQLPATERRSWKQNRGTLMPTDSHAWAWQAGGAARGGWARPTRAVRAMALREAAGKRCSMLAQAGNLAQRRPHLQDARTALDLHRIAVDNHLRTRPSPVSEDLRSLSNAQPATHLDHRGAWPRLHRRLAPPVNRQCDGQLGEPIRVQKDRRGRPLLHDCCQR